MSLRFRRLIMVGVALVGVAVFIANNPDQWQVATVEDPAHEATAPQLVDDPSAQRRLAVEVLAELPVKGRAPKTGYQRAQFGSGWSLQSGCDTRNIILARDLSEVVTNEKCQVVSGKLQDPYTGQEILFQRGPEGSQRVQIDHVVALSNAWQTGARQLDEAARIRFSNDPLNLLAVEGSANQAKGDGDAATWLPPSKPFRCQYVARQIAVKAQYGLWVVPAEKQAMERILKNCPSQRVPSA